METDLRISSLVSPASVKKKKNTFKQFFSSQIFMDLGTFCFFLYADRRRHESHLQTVTGKSEKLMGLPGHLPNICSQCKRCRRATEKEPAAALDERHAHKRAQKDTHRHPAAAGQLSENAFVYSAETPVCTPDGETGKENKCCF